MNPTHRRRGHAARSALLAVFVLAAFVAPHVPAAADVQVIVEAVPGGIGAASGLVDDLGGTIVRDLPIIGGFAATVDERALAALAADPAVARVTPDARVLLLEAADEWGEEFTDDEVVVELTAVEEYALERELSDLEYDLAVSGEFAAVADDVESKLLEVGTPSGDMISVTTTLGARAYWEAGFDGSGVDVAIIDTGIAPVPGMTAPGKVINGLDVSFEGQFDEVRHLDTYGHGTHLAGIIAGRDLGVATDALAPVDEFLGMAPGARLVNVKVAGFDGAVDVSQVIAAVDWVVEHRADNGMNIRVLNLSFGTDGTQDHLLDPLAHAVEVAWDRGIVVVVAAGNDGPDAGLRNPAYDPLVIAVGAVDNQGTRSSADDVVSDFSSCGAVGGVDVVAPGKTILSLRVPGSSADQEHTSARVGDRLFKGSGTSQAAAVVSGAAALVIDQYPAATPDQVKGLLMKTAAPVAGDSRCTGAGVIDLFAALEYGADSMPASWQRSQATGTGSLHLARGSFILEHDGVRLVDEQDIFGIKVDTEKYAKHREEGKAWDGGKYNGVTMSGASWSGASWSGASWGGASWGGASWSGASWSGASWGGASWSGASWGGASWSGASWSGLSWSGLSWSGDGWLGLSWN